METNVSRRDFLKGSIVVALGAAGAATLSSCAGGDAAAKADSAVATAPDTAAKTATLHRGYGAAHGDKCFTSVVVATAEDGTILAASVDDYQFMPADSAGITPVPNSDAGFADGYAEGKVLMSKTVNNDAYSASMKEKAQSTTPWLTSMKAIEAYCTTGAYAGDGSDLKMGRATAAAHGDKAFAEAVSLVQGDVLVASSIDEFQFADASSAGLVPVPNSDAAFAEGYAEGKALMSKSVNSDMYSASMKEKAQSTTPWIESMSAIESFVAGQKIADVKAKGPDAVSGATLVDTAGYVDTAVAAAKTA